MRTTHHDACIRQIRNNGENNCNGEGRKDSGRDREGQETEAGFLNPAVKCVLAVSKQPDGSELYF